VHFQPVVDLASRLVAVMEALARWRISDDEVVEPAVFIPVAEESELICEIGGEVLRRACRAVRDWRAQVPGGSTGCSSTSAPARWSPLSPSSAGRSG
jgi:sensor c-di-GMP phosphodiesterase-like protein